MEILNKIECRTSREGTGIRRNRAGRAPEKLDFSRLYQKADKRKTVCRLHLQTVLFFELTHKDSNLNKQNQNLLCYRYTMGQSGIPPLFDLGVQK